MHEHLTRIQQQLSRMRASEHVLTEQVAHFAEVTADLETRKLVAQTPLADREWREARTDLERHRGLLEETRRRVSDLRDEQDRLLDRLLRLQTVPRQRDDA